MPLYDTIQPLPPTLSRIGYPVATTETRIGLFIWNRLKIIIPLLSLRQAAPQQSKASFDCIRFALSLQCRKETTTTETRKENKYNN